MFKRGTKKQAFNFLAILLLIFSLISPGIATPVGFAQDGDSQLDGHGSIKNDDGEIDYEEATINKEVSFGNKPGEYFIDLTVEGKSEGGELTTDIVIVYDNSNSMNIAMEDGRTRAVVAKEATTNFLNGLAGDENTRFALVTYGSSIFDGEMNQTWAGNPGVTANHSYKQFTSNPDNIIERLPSYVPSDRQHNGSTWHGGTFTQQALVEAGNILSQSDADRQIIVTVTDGAPTLSYINDYSNTNSNIRGDGTSFTYGGGWGQPSGNHGTPTINTADELKENYDMYAIGLGLADGDQDVGASAQDVRDVVNGISTTEDHAYMADTVDEMVDALNEVASQIQTDSVVDGSITDPITDEFLLPEDPFRQAGNENLEDGEFFLSASDDSLLEGVTVKSEDQHILVDGLNLGQGEWVTVRYKVQIDTDNPDLDPKELYKTNGTTTLTPNGDEPDNKREFPEPEASAEPIKVSGKKAWVDWGYDVHRPDEITLQLVREIDGEDVVVDEVVVQNDGTDVWEFEFDNVFAYDTNGQKIEYKLREIMPDGSDEYYELEYGEISEDTTDARNLFQQDAKIQLVKTAKSTSERGEDEIEVGKDINYTFEITNTGNLPLKDINLEDELDGISAIEYETLNDDPLTDDIEDVIMQPGDVLVAIATYKVTQEDLNHGQVDNHAQVVGIPTVPEPDKFSEMAEFDVTPVHDVDNASVPGELDPSISLTKTADKEEVTEVNEEIEYTFEIENTGNTTLTEVTLNDPMLDGEITLGVDRLEPGETTTVTVPYEVTQEDINNGEIVNEADVEGTPPPAYTENPGNPDKVRDEDDEIVEADQKSDISLVKEADRDGLTADETITYTFTATNTGNTTLTNVKITDILDGISSIDYLTVNDDANFDKDNIILEPGDVLVAEATYEVTQDDVDTGQVYNEATVTGTDPKDEEVTDEDDVTITEEAVKGIELEKTSDKQYVTEAGQEIEYTFDVTNTGNVTLTDVIVNDPMLGGEIKVTDSLAPGETVTVTETYTVTQEDIDNDNINNIATAIGTPPNPEDEPPTSPPAEVDVPVAKIDLEKSVLPKIYTEVGQELTYTLVVTNTGEVTLNDVTLTDDMLGGEIELKVDSLEPGESTEVEVPYTVTEADVEAGEIVNKAETEGTPEGYNPENPNTPEKVRDEDDATANYAGLLIEKTSDKEEVEEAGEEIEYTFEVTNVGTTTLENIVVNDDMLAELDIEVELEETTLEPGESTTRTAVYTVTQEDIDNGEVYNVATTTGTPPGYDPEDPEYPDEPPVSPPSENEVPSVQDPDIELEKVADKEEYIEVGEEIVYTFTVTNTGNTTLEDVYVYDETFDENIALILEEHQGPGTETITFEPGQSAVGTYTHVVTQGNLDNGEILNEAITEGTPPESYTENPDNPDRVRDEDDEEVEAKVNVGLSLEKEADEEFVEKAGDEINYTLSVTNIGNVTLTDVTVNDEMLGGDLEVEPSTLAPGETGIVTGTYVVTQEDIDRHEEIINIATATGTPPTDPEDPPVTPPVEEEVPVKDNPEITLVKQADKEELVVDETVTYTFTATNTGTTTLENVNLVDELEGLSDIEYLTVNDEVIGDPNNITLEPGDVLVAEATYEVTQDDVDAGEVYNEAVVEGTPPAKENPEDPENPIEQDPVTDKDDEFLPGNYEPDLSLEKTTETEEVSEAGEVITYKFVVTNTGNVTLDDVRVDDPMLEEAGVDEIELEKTTLAPGESTVGYADYTVTQEDIDNHEEIINIATATGTPPTDPEDPPVTPPVEEEVPVNHNPEIALEKSTETEEYEEVGQEIEYTFTVTNIGNQTLEDVKVYDETFDVNIDLETTTLAPGKSTTGTFTYTVTQQDLDHGEIHNVAKAEGTPPPVEDPEEPDHPKEQYPVEDEDDENVPGKQIADLTIVKEAAEEFVEKAGDEINYTLTVTNTGNVMLEDVTVYDEMLGGDLVVEPSTLAPGEIGTVTGTYVVTQEDIDNHEEIVNIATATGTPPTPPTEDPEDPPVTPPVEEKVPVKDKPEIILEKEADKSQVFEVDEEVIYTFVVTNTGNKTLYELVLNDPMLGGEITLDVSSLAPGESTEVSVTYEVTAEDVEKDEIYNIAEVTGTTEIGDNVSDKDDVTIDVEEGEPGEDLPKTATNMYNFLFLGGAILLLGLIILGYTRRRA